MSESVVCLKEKIVSPHRLGRALRVSLAATALSVVLVPSALAQGPSPPEQLIGHIVIGFQPSATDAGAHSVTGVKHCVSPEQAGRTATFDVADSLDLAHFASGSVMGIEIGRAPGGGAEIVRIVPAPCQVQPAPATSPGSESPPGFAPQPSGAGAGPGHDAPALERKFLNRVWKFVGEVDGYEDGVLSMTLSKVLNLPKRMADQDDELIDEDALVLVGPCTRVYAGTKLMRERREASELASAEKVRVRGKLLPRSKWRKDDDDQPVPTIRAKKVFILG